MTAAAVALLTAGPALAQDSAASGVLTYPPSFFTDARPNTAYDMIGRLPGFSFVDVGSARGFAGTAGNVLINGERPTTKSDSLQSILTRIPAGDVDHIDLIRGGAPGIDMQGQTVMANVVLKTADSAHVVATADDTVFIDGHMIPGASLQYTQHSGASTYEGTVSIIQSYDDSVGHGLHNVFDGSGNLVSQDDTISHGLGLGVSAKGAVTVPLFGGEFKANATYQNSPFVDSLLYFRPGFRELFGDDNRDNIGELGLHWNGTVGGAQLETLVLQRYDNNNASSTSNDGTTDQLFTSHSATGESIARATLRYLPLDNLTLEGAVEGTYNFLNGKTGFFVNGVDQPLPSAKANVSEKRGEIFFQATWKFDPQWTLEAGMRAEASTITETGSVNLSRSFFYPKPRAVLTWAPDSDTQIRLRYEKVLGQLDFNNFIASANLSATGITVGNENIRPDQHDQYEISLERHFWEKGAVVLTLMHEDIKDVVDYVPITDSLGNVFDAPGNIGNGQNNQIELQVTLPLDKLGLENGLLTTTSIFDLTSVRDPVTGTNRVISGQRPQNITINFSKDFTSLMSTFGISYYNCWTEEYYRLEQFRLRKVAPPYFSLSWDYHPSPGWSFHLEGDDIVGFTYKDTRFNYAGPRNVAPLDNIDQYIAHGIPHIDFQIRRTF
ncbi:MAG TPA: TonB-dependent receptor [Rhizomicrobium sp.]|nr:TonB-dependent receptor [Rhizomicrobium sp.]